MNFNSTRIRAALFRVPCKTLLIMKITTILLLISVMTVSASTYAQKITLNEKHAPLSDVLEKIRQQSGYDLIFTDNLVKNAPAVTINIKDASIDDALNILLANQQISYEIEDKTIVFKEKAPSIFEKLRSTFSAIDIHGRVVDEAGKALPGVTVKVKDGNQVTISDPNGRFFLKQVDEHGVLVFTFIGYLPKELSVSADLENVKMAISNAKLDEVQVIAYGQTSRRLAVGNVASVKAAEIEKQPVNNPLLALAGRVPGLTVVQSTGYANGGVTVRIQGQNSINNGNDPLYVVDGVPFNAQLLPAINQIGGTSGGAVLPPAGLPSYGNPFSFLNPADIESIDVLKDADATAIYGSRAANGAILITTKKGKPGKLSTAFNLQQGYGSITRRFNMLNTSQYLEMRREAIKNDGHTPDPDKDFDLFNNYGWGPERYTDWQKQLIGNTASYTDLQGNISGGSDLVQYLVGAGYHHETAVIPSDFGDRKASLHFSLNASSSDHKFRVDFSGSFMADDNRLPNTDLAEYAIFLPPNAPDIYNPDGSINQALDKNGNSTWGYSTNPVAPLLNRNRNQTNNLTSSLGLSYNLPYGLQLKSSFGYNRLASDEYTKLPLDGYPLFAQPYFSRSTTFADNRSSSWIIEPQLLFLRQFGDLKVDALFGGTVRQNNNSSTNILAEGYTNDESLDEIAGAGKLTLNNAYTTDYRYNAIFARLALNLSDRYLLNLTARRDGSSRFGAANHFHTFASAGGAWIFSSEKFIHENLGFLSFGKLRLSYGTTGSDQIGDYRYLSLYGPVGALPYQGTNGLVTNSLGNAYLQWEETRKLQGGIELGFLKDRVLFNATYFRNRSSNQLMNASLAATTGFSGITTNFPATVQNTGWELSLNTVNISSGALRWTSALNVTIPRNKLIRYDADNAVTNANLVVGQSLSVIKLYDYAGVNPQTGLYQFHKADGTISSTLSYPADQYVMANFDPRYYGGFQNSLTYKSLSLDIFIQFVNQKGPNYIFGRNPGYFSGQGYNQPTFVLDRWQKPGDVATIQRYNADLSVSAGANTAKQSNAAYTDASYARLKNVALSWILPSTWQRVIHTSQAQLFLNAQNLATITGYKAGDPETKGIGTLPPLRVTTLGIKATF